MWSIINLEVLKHAHGPGDEKRKPYSLWRNRGRHPRRFVVNGEVMAWQHMEMEGDWSWMWNNASMHTFGLIDKF